MERNKPCPIMKITLKSAKKKAWSAFSKYIRTKNMNFTGTIHCYTCDKLMSIKDSQSGHGLPGRNNAVLFMEEVVRPQCKQCNIFKSGNLAVFTRKLIEELGLKRYDELVELSKQIVQYKTYQFLEIEEKYKQKLVSLNR